MKCAHCGTNFHDDWAKGMLVRDKRAVENFRQGAFWAYRTTRCSACQGVQVDIGLTKDLELKLPVGWRRVFPSGANRGPVPKEVPVAIATDYVEACDVFPISPKASAALSRRCLQNMLRQQGYRARDLNAEIDLLLKESDPLKAIPRRLRDTIDAIRNFGNFSAHPVTETTALQIIDVEPEEAEWCLEILEECFEHFYVGPEAAKAKKAALDAKLIAAGKPPSK